MKPAAVLRQAKAADQLVKDLNANPGNAAAIAAAAAPAPPAAPGQPPQVPDNLPSIGDVPPPGATPVAAEPAKPVDWEQKFKVLQGKYDAEVPRLLDTLNQTGPGDTRARGCRRGLPAAGN